MNDAPTAACSNSLAELTGVSKWYGPVMGVNDVTLRLAPGITGLVGPNGAGKSTLMKLLTGQLRPSLGSVRVHGRNAWSAAAKSHLGYCPDVDAFYEEMSGRSFVRTIAQLHGFSRRQAERRTEEVLADVAMTDRAARPLGSYSKGMRQRIKLAQALVHDPQILVLDEPLNGVDPVGRAEMTGLFRRLVAAGKVILLSSHILEDMDRLADHILFISHGRILASGSLSQIREMLDDQPLKIRLGAPNARRLAARLLEWDFVRAVEMEGDGELVVQVRQPKRFFGLIADLAVDEGFAIDRLQVRDASTEAVFHYLMDRAGQ